MEGYFKEQSLCGNLLQQTGTRWLIGVPNNNGNRNATIKPDIAFALLHSDKVEIHFEITFVLYIELSFHPFIRGLSATAPRTWYASLFAKPGCRYQPSRANSKIGYKVGSYHSSPPLRRETAAAGPSFLAAATTSSWPNYRLLDIDPNLFFLPPARRGLRGHLYKVLQATAFSVRVVKYWKKLPVSVVTASSVKRFQKRLEKDAFPISPIDWTLTSPFLYSPPSHLHTTY